MDQSQNLTRRQLFHEILCTALGSRNVYYQPPESIKMEYPAIVYDRKPIEKIHADNTAYKLNQSYRVVLIDRRPDSPIVDNLIRLPYSSHVSNYRADNLAHDVFEIYY